MAAKIKVPEALEIDGQRYPWDQRLMLSEARFLMAHFGLTASALGAALEGEDPEAIAALVTLIKRRAGETVDPKTLDFDINSVRPIFPGE